MIIRKGKNEIENSKNIALGKIRHKGGERVELLPSFDIPKGIAQVVEDYTVGDSQGNNSKRVGLKP